MSPKELLLDRLNRRRSVVGVVGLGYVGLPLAMAFAEAGFQVVGFDIDSDKVDRIQKGESYLGSVSTAELAARVDSGNLAATADFARLSEPDVILICVPTPLSREMKPDLGYVEETSRRVLSCLREGQLVVLESTSYPGTTAEIVQPILSESGLVCGREYFLAYSPERENPGDRAHSVGTVPKIVGGIDDPSSELAAMLYSKVAPRVVKVSSAAAAEATKLTENVFRAVNISLVNELKMIFDKMGLDVWEILDAAETKPFGFMRFSPGPGLGGHCIPIDPLYLAARAAEFGAQARFIELSAEINAQMPQFVVDKATDALRKRGLEVSECRVLVLGIAYKKDVEDPRESPAFEIVARLLKLGAEVEYHDPFIPRLPPMRSWPDLPDLESVLISPTVLSAMDAVVLVTDHSRVDYDLIWKHSSLIVDTRGVYRREDPRLIKA